MFKRVAALILVGMGLVPAVASAQGAEPSATTPPVPAPAPTEQPTGLGTDGAMDLLANACFNGTMQACDDLYDQSPASSAYETYGDTCAGRQPAATGVYCTAVFTDTVVQQTSPTTTTPSTAAGAVPATPAVDPLFPIIDGANGPAVAAIQGRLDISVDCDFGNQTAEAIRAWQTERGDLAVTGQIGADEWTLLDIPTTWGTDTNGNGTIEPSEVTLVCDGNVELPAAPVDTTGWPDTALATLAEVCGISSEAVGDSYVQYSPEDDSITASSVQPEDEAVEGTAWYQTMCVISIMPDHVISQISSTRALDGMQEATFGEMAVFWNYHPDNGINLTVYSA